jgi:uncharacterized protein YjbJ (UPF0337 family)
MDERKWLPRKRYIATSRAAVHIPMSVGGKRIEPSMRIAVQVRELRCIEHNIIQGGTVMNKDRVEGKVKDVAGRAQRQAGEWTGDTEQQTKGTLKQAEGKVQNAWGKVKDAAQDAADEAKERHANKQAEDETKSDRDDLSSRRAS